MTDTPASTSQGLTALHNWCGGKSHFMILLCTFIGVGFAVFCCYKNHIDALWPVLTFLGAMSGVQVNRSYLDDKYGK